MKRLDRDPSILQWSSEETVVPYKHPISGYMHRYYPDFVVKARSDTGEIKTMMVEVKPYKETIEPVQAKGKKKETLLQEAVTYSINQAKWTAARRYCARKGWEFAILTEVELFGEKK